jgi:hypothetical protein
MRRSRTLLVLMATFGCQVTPTKSDVLAELPPPRLAALAQNEARGELSLAPSSSGRVEWFAGAQRVATQDVPLTGQIHIDEEGRLLDSQLTLDLGSTAEAPAWVRALPRSAQSLALDWGPISPFTTQGPPCQLRWGQHRGELPSEWISRAAGSRKRLTLRTRRAVPVALQDYAQVQSIEFDGARKTLTEARLSLVLELQSESGAEH